jgi:uncharacterized protein (DUF2141 family)
VLKSAARLVSALAALVPSLAIAMPSSPDLGKVEGQCRKGESGPAFLVNPVGLKDRKGILKLEVYPANEDDFLADDNLLLMAGKTFRRIEVPLPSSGAVNLCIRVPGPGTYAVSLLHDRDINRKFNWTVDGIGFSGNPKLGWGKPKVGRATARAGSAPTRISIILNYKRGLGVAPLKRRD